MQNHKSYTVLAPILQKYPPRSRILVPDIQRHSISGKRPNTVGYSPHSQSIFLRSIQDVAVYVVPCSLAETLSFDWLQQAFAQLQDPQEIFLAITSDDASLVYYKLSRGMVKPQL
ncbi:Sen15 domain-containing protein [Mycena chlorophos]|uniref:Sen15 domain-containing protein n=1 Tax=Mycena chlorophos TaxID=658473 RepID=A0A8H6VZE4_MYCCL|nr:Sen15 domain-containing protein [Mycena chlorophos]